MITDTNLLAKKKESGEELSENELYTFISDVVNLRISNDEIVRVLSAMYKAGLSFNETLTLTDAYVKSGKTIDLSELGPYVVDKHSTGGVGDKISIILIPWLASVGAKILKLSGRSLGFTGGTIDKLESIPGFQTNIEIPQLIEQVKKVGCGIVSAGPDLCPADKITYALRDEYNLVDEIGLIAASVLSKKIAGGAKNVVIDLKVGIGAFMHTIEEATKLAKLLCNLASHFHIKLSCVLTRMDNPLGLMIGNANEVAEAFEFLEKKKTTQDVFDITVALGTEALLMMHMADNYNMALDFLLINLEDGNAWVTLNNWIKAQSTLPLTILPQKNVKVFNYYSSKSGWLKSINAKTIGEITRELGGGRLKAEDKINHNVGIQLYYQVGSYVSNNNPVLALYHKNNSIPQDWLKRLDDAIVISDNQPPRVSCVIDIIRNW